MKKLVIALMLIGLVGLAQAELVLYLPFDNATQATDQSCMGNYGTFVGSAAVTTVAENFKLGDGAVDITAATVADGVKGVTDNGFSYGNDAWSMIAWVKTTDTYHLLMGRLSR